MSWPNVLEKENSFSAAVPLGFLSFFIIILVLDILLEPIFPLINLTNCFLSPGFDNYHCNILFLEFMTILWELFLFYANDSLVFATLFMKFRRVLSFFFSNFIMSSI